MQYSFGTYILDEEARELALNGAPIPVQPKVFDLLRHLVRNAGRVVSKDELMDALWPNVIVTEASLQRLVSLARRALEPGGLGEAIRSFVRHGYRFSVDEPPLLPAAPTEDEGSLRDQAMTAVRERRWHEAVGLFQKLDAAGGLTGADLDVWALAAECTGVPTSAIPVLTRAIARHVAEGAPQLAARDAVTLAKLEIERSAPAAATGWMDRAAALKAGEDDPRTDAYYLWMASRMASFAGRGETALELANASVEAARRCQNPGLIALALSYQGFYAIALGRTEEGIGAQNHAAAIALSSGVDPVIGSNIYCNILWACRTYPDWNRARQWSLGFETWCSINYAKVPGTCDLHRAEILGAQRDLSASLVAIEEALPKLAEEESWAIGDAYRVRGDVRAMLGDLDLARADYAAAYAIGWDAEPGNALLLAEIGEIDAALQALDRAMAGTTWYHLHRRIVLLAHKARIAALGGRRELSEETLARLDDEPQGALNEVVRALISETRHLLERGRSDGAIRHLLLARQLWTSAGIDYHAARVRLDLARLLRDAGDLHGAEAEIAAAETTGHRIGSPRLIEAAGGLRAALRPPAQTAV